EQTGMISVSAEALKNSPAQKDIKTFVASMSSDIKTDSEGQLYFRGGRPTSIVYFVDGVKISGNFQTLPSSGVGSISVYTGGIPAKYGDTTSGVIVIESKNYFDLYNQWLYN
ncbi:MAG: TonB-dependent receptor plug domain-containing protein, partial [Flavobacteriales bacterium]